MIEKNTSYSTFKYLLFWIGVYTYYILIANMNFYKSYSQAFEMYAMIVGIQMVVAFVSIRFLIPKFLNKGKNIPFIIGILMLLLSGFSAYILIRINYFEVKYFDIYNASSPEYIKKGFAERFVDLSFFLSKSILFLTPTVLLLLARFYKNQEEYLKLNEQKKIAELSALKNQLNPHFLFNTLNNLYSLAIKKSDKTPEVIGKLSDILDYMLYRCDEKYVWLNKEIELIENYLSLEKIRYGKRVELSFETALTDDVKIAPLLLLTFIENAFKHGVREELGTAKIDIKIKGNEDEIFFFIQNTIPDSVYQEENEKEAIGLKNVNKQLDLLYPNKHKLEIQRQEKLYKVELKITL